MQHKIKLSAILLTLLFAITPLTVITANAQTFDLNKPTFGLYCENQNADVHGNVKYVIDEQGNVVEYSEYTVTAPDDLTLYIPFISNAYELPEIDLTVNGKAVTNRISYGESYFFNNGLKFYSSDIDESITGTLYTLTTENKSLTVNFKTYDKQNFIYLLPYNRSTQSANGEYSFTLDNAQIESAYEIYAINGDFETFESNADVRKETLTLKDYIDRSCNKFKDDYGVSENINTEFFYALANKMLECNINCEYYNLFFDSVFEQRINAYKIELPTDAENCTIAYSMPVEMQKNIAFNPAKYLIEQAATGNYGINYTIELNDNFPYIIESNANIKKQSDYVYTVENITDDFYFVFSSVQNPQSIFKDNNTLKIILVVILSVILCATVVFFIIMLRRYLKTKIR